MDTALDRLFAALADPTRRRILTLLLEDDMAVTDVAAPFGISLAAVSKHLGVLARAGLISRERRGRVTWCRLEPDALKPASVWMQGFGVFEPVDLDLLEGLLAAQALENEIDDGQDDDDQAHDVDDLIHEGALFNESRAPDAGSGDQLDYDEDDDHKAD